PFEPGLVDDGFDEQEAVGEVELPLLLREHPGLVGEDLVRLHGAPLDGLLSEVTCLFCPVHPRLPTQSHSPLTAGRQPGLQPREGRTPPCRSMEPSIPSASPSCANCCRGRTRPVPSTSGPTPARACCGSPAGRSAPARPAARPAPRRREPEAISSSASTTSASSSSGSAR